jgi:hypothetical protein
MFEKVNQAAEKLATNVSRREFVGGLGKGALVLAGAMGAMLAFPRLVEAGRIRCPCQYGAEVTGGIVCIYLCPDGLTKTASPERDCTCKLQHRGCALFSRECFFP